VYSKKKKTPDDGQRNCPKHVVLFQNKLDKLVHLVSFTIRSLMTFMPTECKYVYIPQWVCRSHFKSHYTLWDKIMYLYAQNLRNIYSNKCISVEAVLCCDLHLVWRALYDRWKPHLVRWGEGDRNWRGGVFLSIAGDVRDVSPSTPLVHILPQLYKARSMTLTLELQTFECRLPNII
jgi:hypothetical protein